MAMKAKPESLAYMAMINPSRQGKPDAIGVVDVDPASKSYGKLVGQTNMPNAGDELHHFGWNACSACLCPYAPHPHMERRYLIVPGINSSRIHILDTKPDLRWACRSTHCLIAGGSTVSVRYGWMGARW
jgi:selenium-binding protein 1